MTVVLTAQSKNSVTLTALSKNSVTLTPQTKGTGGAVIASAGLYYGFGAFTYSGGEVLVPAHLPILTPETKH